MKIFSKISILLVIIQISYFSDFFCQSVEIPPPDVCPGEQGLIYGVDGYENSTFVWIISGGYFVNENGTRHTGNTLITQSNTVIVDWIESSDIISNSYSLSVVEYTPQGCYGDTVSVDIGFKEASKVILLNERVRMDTCVNTNVTLDAGAGFIYYEWDANDGDLTKRGEDARYFDIASTDPTSFEVVVRVLSKDTCESGDTVRIDFRLFPEIEFSSEEDETGIIKLGDSLEICKYPYEISLGEFTNCTYEWSTGDDSPTITMEEVENDSAIFVGVTNEYGCKSVDTMLITKCPNRVNPPSAFTPNGDGHNEVWEIEGINRFENAIIVVYDRYGNKVFESDIPYQPWDGTGENGKLLPVDSYHYIIKLNDEEKQIEIGQVTIAY